MTATTTYPGADWLARRLKLEGEPPCAACRAAWAEYQREMYQRRKGRA